MKKTIIFLFLPLLLFLSGCPDKPGLLRVDSKDATAYSADLTYNFINNNDQDSGGTVVGISVRSHKASGSFAQEVVSGTSLEISPYTSFNGPTVVSGDVALKHSEIRLNVEQYLKGGKASIVLGGGFQSQGIELDIRNSILQDSTSIHVSTPLFLMAGLRYHPIDTLYVEYHMRMGLGANLTEQDSYGESNLLLCYSPVKQASLCGGYREIDLYITDWFRSDLEVNMKGPAAEMRLQF